jgi:hypothetical protein
MDRMMADIPRLLIVLAVASAPGSGQDKAATPAEQYQALLKDEQELPDQIPKAPTEEERKKLQARWANVPQSYLELAERYPQDPVAVEALMRAVGLGNNSIFPNVGKDSLGIKALAILQRDHLKSDKLGLACQFVVFGFHETYESFLRAVQAANPHPDVQGLACLSLAQFLSVRRNRLDVLRDQDQPESRERYYGTFGKEFVEGLERQDRAKEAAEIEALFARALERHAAVQIPVTYYGSGGTVGEKAEAELYQIRFLAPGKPAPEIEGEDQDGKRFKLSDYRGKVVLLDIWNHQ